MKRLTPESCPLTFRSATAQAQHCMSRFVHKHTKTQVCVTIKKKKNQQKATLWSEEKMPNYIQTNPAGQQWWQTHNPLNKKSTWVDISPWSLHGWQAHGRPVNVVLRPSGRLCCTLNSWKMQSQKDVAASVPQHGSLKSKSEGSSNARAAHQHAERGKHTKDQLLGLWAKKITQPGWPMMMSCKQNDQSTG